MAEMDIYEVLKYLPQRYPVLMIDRVKECEPGKRIVALKNVSANEPFFQGHFPGRPIMPGVLILERWPKPPGVVFSAEDMADHRDRVLYYYVCIATSRCQEPLVPGDTRAGVIYRTLRGIGKFAASRASSRDGRRSNDLLRAAVGNNDPVSSRWCSRRGPRRVEVRPYS